MADKIVALSFMSPIAFPVKLILLDGKLRGKVVDASTWTPPSSNPISGCRGKRPCIGMCSSPLISETTRGAISNACTFTISGAVDKTCSATTTPSSGPYAGYTVATTITTSGWDDVNGSYVATATESTAFCDIRFVTYKVLISASVTFHTTLTSPSPFNVVTELEETCDVTIEVTVSCMFPFAPCNGAQIIVRALKGGSTSTTVISENSMGTVWPCQVSAATEQGLTAEDPSLASGYNGTYPATSTCTTLNCGRTWPVAIDLNSCCPWSGLAISRVWS